MPKVSTKAKEKVVKKVTKAKKTETKKDTKTTKAAKATKATKTPKTRITKKEIEKFKAPVVAPKPEPKIVSVNKDTKTLELKQKFSEEEIKCVIVKVPLSHFIDLPKYKEMRFGRFDGGPSHNGNYPVCFRIKVDWEKYTCMNLNKYEIAEKCLRFLMKPMKEKTRGKNKYREFYPFGRIDPKSAKFVTLNKNEEYKYITLMCYTDINKSKLLHGEG